MNWWEESTHLPKMHWAVVSPPTHSQFFEVTSKARGLKINSESLTLTAHQKNICICIKTYMETWDQISGMTAQKQTTFSFCEKSFSECKRAIFCLACLKYNSCSPSLTCTNYCVEKKKKEKRTQIIPKEQHLRRALSSPVRVWQGRNPDVKGSLLHINPTQQYWPWVKSETTEWAGGHSSADHKQESVSLPLDMSVGVKGSHVENKEATKEI